MSQHSLLDILHPLLGTFIEDPELRDEVVRVQRRREDGGEAGGGRGGPARTGSPGHPHGKKKQTCASYVGRKAVKRRKRGASYLCF